VICERPDWVDSYSEADQDRALGAWLDVLVAGIPVPDGVGGIDPDDRLYPLRLAKEGRTAQYATPALWGACWESPPFLGSTFRGTIGARTDAILSGEAVEAQFRRTMWLRTRDAVLRLLWDDIRSGAFEGMIGQVASEGAGP
jgi:hypothetical protein